MSQLHCSGVPGPANKGQRVDAIVKGSPRWAKNGAVPAHPTLKDSMDQKSLPSPTLFKSQVGLKILKVKRMQLFSSTFNIHQHLIVIIKLSVIPFGVIHPRIRSSESEKCHLALRGPRISASMDAKGIYERLRKVAQECSRYMQSNQKILTQC